MPTGPKIAIVVEFLIKPGMERDFDAHIRDHAAKTLAEEPGCERFDVLHPVNDDGTPDASRVMLFELYADSAAFDAHRQNPRMPAMAQRSAGMVERRTLHRCEVVGP